MGFYSCACGVLPPGSSNTQVPIFPVDVDAEDDPDELCLTPCPFTLLDVVSSVEGEPMWSV